MAFDFAGVMMNPAILITVIVWSLLWKGIALWESARRNEGKLSSHKEGQKPGQGVFEEIKILGFDAKSQPIVVYFPIFLNQ